jgi:hypothetical protein
MQQDLEHPIELNENAEISANISDEDDFPGFNREEQLVRYGGILEEMATEPK